ncbi:MAG: endonuclease NucS domain-containing protein [Promethearchaeota archaeon]
MTSSKIHILSYEPELLVKKLNHLLSVAVLIIAGTCRAYFDGRIKSTLQEGDRILICKKDQAFILHGPKGIKPLQWQLASAGKLEFQLKDDEIIFKTFRPKTLESITISFSSIALACSFDAEDNLPITIYGDESDLVQFLVQNPEEIEEGFSVLRNELETPYGKLDIWGQDTNGNYCIVEVKKRPATLSDAHQLERYYKYFEQENYKIRGILLATNIPKGVQKFLRDHFLDWKVLPWQEIFPTLHRVPSVTLDKFFENS